MPALTMEFAPSAWALLALAAALIGFSKTALPGINTVSIAVFAALLPPKASTGALLVLLILGDALALLSYRRHAHWPTLLRLIPSVAAGLAVGAVFLALAEDSLVGRLIGCILLALVALNLWQRRRATRHAGTAGPQAAPARVAWERMGFGALAGFTTMVANAGGPVMSLYLLASRLSVQAFLGTAAWFFAVINVAKLPVSIGLGLITPESLTLDALLAPAVLLGAALGRWIATRVPQRAFEWAVLAGTALGASYLLVG